MKVISFIASMSGDIIDEIYPSVYHCAEGICEQYGLTLTETEEGLRRAIEHGSEFPVGSGFTYDYLLEYSEQKELF